jgi:hypothetical protein
MRKLGSLAFFAVLAGCVSTQAPESPRQSSLSLFDIARQRSIPVELYLPARALRCTSAHPCPVAIISAGYGISNTSYAFISSALGELGYLTVAVQHELPSDPPLATNGDLFTGRKPNWQRGAENLRFVRNSLRRSHPGFNWEDPVLIGHSNGGDISAWLVRESPIFAGSLVTLDNRRVPLPRGSSPRVLSIRASDFQPDSGVLPTDEELESFGSCVVKINDAKHNDMQDGGPIDLKDTISRYIVNFLNGGTCKAVVPSNSFKPKPLRGAD